MPPEKRNYSIIIRHEFLRYVVSPHPQHFFPSLGGAGITLTTDLKNFDERLRRNVVGLDAQLLEGFVVFERAGEVGRGKVSHGAVRHGEVGEHLEQ